MTNEVCRDHVRTLAFHVVILGICLAVVAFCAMSVAGRVSKLEESVKALEKK